MSGGAFEYQQYKIDEIADQVEREINRMGTEKPKDELWSTDEFYKKYPEEKFYPTYSDEAVKAMRDGVKALKTAYVYAQRIDWFLSGDDGEESFVSRLNDELEKLKNED